MLTFTAGPRTASDGAVIALLRRVAAGELSVADALSVLLELSAEADFDGDVAGDAVLIAAETSGAPDLDLAHDLLMTLLVASDGEVVLATGSVNRPVDDWEPTVRSTVFTAEVKVPAAAP